MRWVKETLPPTVRARCALMRARFSMRSLAGIWRWEVAVGMESEASMCLAVARAADLRMWSSSCEGAPWKSVKAARPCCWRV